MMYNYHYENMVPVSPFDCIIAFIIYFLPAIVAFYRRHHNRMAILILNLLLGWSGLGWIIALIWSFTVVQK